jgi:hypothetical protein
LASPREPRKLAQGKSPPRSLSAISAPFSDE